MVKDMSGMDCATLATSVKCNFVLTAAGMTLPAGLPSTATISTVCPGSCSGCTTTCSANCPDWFLGNGYCDEGCNSAACNYDSGDCSSTSSTPSSSVATPTVSLCSDGETYLMDQCMKCEDPDSLVAEMMPGQTCASLVKLVTCNYALGSSGLSLPSGVSSSALLGDICPGSCGKCSTSCSTNCPDWFAGNGYCDSACNNAACNYDDGDCTSTGGSTGGSNSGSSATATCANNKMDGDEIYIDCGGSCRACRACTGSGLKSLVSTYNVSGTSNGYAHTATRTLTCAAGLTAAPPANSSATSATSEQITCRDGTWSTPTLQCLAESVLSYESTVTLKAAVMRYWDATASQSIFESLTTALQISTPYQELRLISIDLGGTGGADDSSDGGCVDNPLLSQWGYTCQQIAAYGKDLVCGMQLLALAKTQGMTSLPTGIPDDTLMKDACPLTCGVCTPASRRRLNSSSNYEIQKASLIGESRLVSTYLSSLEALNSSSISSNSKSLRRKLQTTTTDSSSSSDLSDLISSLVETDSDYISVGFSVTSTSGRSFSVSSTAASLFYDQLKIAVNRNNLSFLNPQDPRASLSASALLSNVNAGVAVTFSNVTSNTRDKATLISSSVGSSSISSWTDLSAVLVTADILGLPQFTAPSTSLCNSTTASTTNCCGLSSELKTFFQSDCGRYIYSGRVQDSYVRMFCRGDLTKKTTVKSCGDQLKDIVTKYEGRVGDACEVMNFYKDFANSICMREPTTSSSTSTTDFCFSSIVNHMTYLRGGMDSMTDLDDSQLDVFCAYDGCFRSNARFVMAVTILSEGKSGFKTGAVVQTLQDVNIYMHEWTDELVDAVCLKVDSAYCQSELKVISATPVSQLTSSSNGTMSNICMNSCTAKKAAQLGIACQSWGQVHRSPYHEQVGLMLRSYGRFACVDEVGGQYSNINNKFCGDHLYDGNVTYTTRTLPNALTASPTGCACKPWFIGDGQCDPLCYSSACNWDNGDCDAANQFPDVMARLTQPLNTTCFPSASVIATTRATCTSTCLAQLQGSLMNSGCCVSGAVELVRELSEMADMSKTLQTITNTPVLQWHPAVLEQSCTLAMDRTCSAATTRVAIKLDVIIINLSYSKLSSSTASLNLTVSRVALTLAKQLGVVSTDVARSYARASYSGNVNVVVEIDAGAEAYFIKQYLTSSPATIQHTLFQIERDLYSYPALVQASNRQNSNSPITVESGPFMLISRDAQSIGVSNRQASDLPLKSTQGMGIYDNSATTEACNSASLAVYSNNYTVTAVTGNSNARTITCVAGYYSPSTTSVTTDRIVCTNGIWAADNNLRCRKSCPATHPGISSTGMTYAYSYAAGSTSTLASHGSSVTVECISGYLPSSSNNVPLRETVYCQDGAWSPLEVECQKTCSAFSQSGYIATIDSSTPTPDDSNSWQSGSILRVNCDKDYYPTPYDATNVKITCNSGIWSLGVTTVDTTIFTCTTAVQASTSVDEGGFLVLIVKMVKSPGVGGWLAIVFCIIGVFALGYFVWFKLGAKQQTLLRHAARENKFSAAAKDDAAAKAAQNPTNDQLAPAESAVESAVEAPSPSQYNHRDGSSSRNRHNSRRGTGHNNSRRNSGDYDEESGYRKSSSGRNRSHHRPSGRHNTGGHSSRR